MHRCKDLIATEARFSRSLQLSVTEVAFRKEIVVVGEEDYSKMDELAVWLFT